MSPTWLDVVAVEPSTSSVGAVEMLIIGGICCTLTLGTLVVGALVLFTLRKKDKPA